MGEAATVVFFIRHAESFFIPNMERERGLTEKGKEDALKIINLLNNERIEVWISSPYQRAVQTISCLANEQKKEIVLVEELREREIGTIPEGGFEAAKKRVYEDFDYAFPSGESSRQAQDRAVTALKRILQENCGRQLVIGTHGDIMTLMLNDFDKKIGYEFWKSSTMPDIYKAEFFGEELRRVERLWTA
jgi:2,3-bisphosphoglycerate-dependent phosphoglycerate mutase